MKAINRLIFMLRLITQKNKATYFLLLLEITVFIILIHSVAWNVFGEIHDKANYFKDGSDNMAAIAINMSIESSYIYEKDGNGLDSWLRSFVSGIDGIKDVAYTNISAAVINGFNANVVEYGECLINIPHPLKKGTWFSDKKHAECIISGELEQLYNIGDIIYINGPDGNLSRYEFGGYTVIGILDGKQYVLNTSGSGKPLEISFLLTNIRNSVIYLTDRQSEGAYNIASSFIIEYNPAVTDIDKLNYELQGKGIVYSFDEIIENSNNQKWIAVKNNLPIIIIVALITLIISSSGLLLSLDTNLKYLSICYICGESKSALIKNITGCFGFLFIISYCLALISIKAGVLNVFAVASNNSMLPEGAVIAIVSLALLLLINHIIIRRMFVKQPVEIYVDKR
ncbi:MAG: hypothetical protein ACYCWE_22030 [Eubacteriales bacterium]